MSIKWMTYAWSEGPKDSTLLLTYLALCDNANDDGEAFPSMPVIAAKSRLSVRQAQRVIATLEKDGWLSVTRGDGRGNRSRYTVHKRVTSTSPFSGERVTPATPFIKEKGDIHDTLSKKKGDTSDTLSVVKGDMDVTLPKLERVTSTTLKGDMGDVPFNVFNRQLTTNLKHSPVVPMPQPPPDSKGDTLPDPPIVKLDPVAALGKTEIYNLANLVALASPHARLKRWNVGQITRSHRLAVVTAAIVEAEELGISLGEAMEGLLSSVTTQCNLLPEERWEFQGGIETYFRTTTYRTPAKLLMGGNNGKSKGEQTANAVRAVLTKLRGEGGGGVGTHGIAPGHRTLGRSAASLRH